MGIHTTLVTYRGISEALRKNHEAVMTATHHQATAAVRDPTEAASKLAGLAEALKVLEAAEKYPDERALA